jgi:cytochrome b
MVWDLPTRLFHWGFVISITGAYISGERGAVNAHELFGLAACGLLAFRLVWGVVGHDTARFANFLHGPKIILAYLRDILARRSSLHRGHNPLGALAVMALLGLMGAMSVTGLWTGDDILYEAPLTALAPDLAPDLAGPMGAWHQRLHVLVIPLVALHVLALLAHRLWLGEKLASRMVSGGTGDTLPSPKSTKAGLALLSLCVGGALSLSLLTPSY